MGRSRAARFSASSLFVLAAALASPAFAQDAPQPAEAAEDGNDIVITGVRASLRDAIEVKRDAPLVMEAISSEDIGQLPDVTIAESLVRLPGLNGSRDRGNASQAAIRGLGPRLVFGLVNGREVASSEPDRNIRWEIYPSEVVNGVEVYKAQSANLIAGGVAGTVNIRTLAPLDYEGPSAVLRAGPVYYDGGVDFPGYDNWGSRVSGSYVARLSDEFAVVFGATFQDQQNGYASFQGWGYNDDRLGGNPGDLNGDTVLDYTPWGMQTEIKMLEEQRTAFMGGAQWRPTSNFELQFDALWSEVTIDEHQNQAWYCDGTCGNWANGNFGNYNAPGSSYTFDSDGNVVAATLANSFVQVNNVIAQYDEDKTLFVTGLNGEWTNGPWAIVGDLSYSEAERDNTWRAIQSPVFPASMSFDTRAGITPFVTTSSNPADTSIQALQTWRNGSHDGPESVSDELTAAALTVSYDLGDGSLFSGFDGGLRVSTRTKAHNRFSATASVAAYTPIPSDLLWNYQIDAFTVPAILDGDFNAIWDLYTVTTPVENLADRWSVDEQVVEGFAMAEFASDNFGAPMRGNVGVRFVSVETSSSGFESVGGGPLQPLTIDHDYAEALPSLNVTWELNEDLLLRLGLARVIARPPLDELRAGRSIEDPGDPPPLTGFGGNPQLDPLLANQADLSLEYYFHDEALAAVAVYVKDVETNIGYFTSPVDIDGDIYQMTGPANGDGGRITGVELTFQTPFYFIPGMDDFGIYSNYAFVDSDIQEFYPWYNPVDGSGFAEHTATVDLWYNNGPFEARLGYKYHSPFTVIAGWNGSDVRTLEEESIWDASASYQFTDRLGVRFQVNNLFNEVARIYRDNDPDRLGRYDVYGRRYLLDFTYRMN
jgi:TonB-dependent receptor